MISTEKAMKMMHEYLDQHSGEIKDENDIDRLIASFTKEYNSSLKKGGAKSVYDYLEEAEKAETYDEYIAALKKALAIEPDNADAMCMLLSAEKGDEPEELIDALSALISKISATEEMKAHLANDIGEFWGILDTRPYMRVRQKHMDTMIECGMYTAAAEEGEELIKLNTTDNLGIRFTLMTIYAMREDVKSARALHKKYENGDETQMLLPLAVLFYRKHNFDKAGEYLKRLLKANKDTAEFFSKMSDSKKRPELLSSLSDYYTLFSIEELVAAVLENRYLYITSESFFSWANRWIRKNK